MKYRTDETWHRLLEWTESSAKSERLAAQILYDAGYSDIDPIHPLGGKDGGKDAKCTKDGKSWIMAVYFPRGQKSGSDITDKFASDLKGAIRNAADGVVFVTNQELRLVERRSLEVLAGKIGFDLFHLERIASVLDKPTMAGVREQFLGIDFSNEELTQAIRAEIAQSESRITGYQIGGETFCYCMFYDFDPTQNIARQFAVIRKGEFPLFNLRIRIGDMDQGRDILKKNWGEISAPAEYTFSKWLLPSRAYYRFFFHARNGQWHQDLQLMRSERTSCWLAATLVSDKLEKPCFEHSDHEFEEEFGAPVWRS